MSIQKIYKFYLKVLSVILAVTLMLPQGVCAQSALNLPQPGAMISLSAPYHPAIIKGMTLYPDNPLKFDFIVDPGDDNLQGDELKSEANKLINANIETQP